MIDGKPIKEMTKAERKEYDRAKWRAWYQRNKYKISEKRKNEKRKISTYGL